MHRILTRVLLLACLAAACGEDHAKPERGAVSSGLPPDQILSELSDAQLESLCRAFVHAADEEVGDELPELDCTFQSIGQSIGVSLSGQVRFDLAKCEMLVRECVAAAGADGGPAPVSGFGNVDCASPAATAAQRSCSASVAQYERCYSAVVADFDALLMRTGCAQGLTALDAGMPAPAMVTPPQCAELRQACPQISIPATHLVEPAAGAAR